MLKPFVFLAALVFVPLTTHARISDLRSYGPLQTRSQNPLYLQFLALPMESPVTLNRHQFEAALSTTFSNTFEFSPGATTVVNLDMESWRHTVSLGFGVTDAVDVRLEVPFISNGAGFLDSFIQWYHNLVGLPNGGRNLVANRIFAYSVTQGGTALVSHSSKSAGLSDLVLRGKWEVSRSVKLPFKLALAPYIKLPTGDEAAGFSSGHVDVGASLLVQEDFKRFHMSQQVGAVYVTGHDALDPILKTFMFSFGQSFEFQLADGFSVTAQLTGNTPLFQNVDAAELSQIVLDLNVGFAGSFALSRSVFDEFFYQCSFSEDVMGSGPSTDFSVFFAAGVRY